MNVKVSQIIDEHLVCPYCMWPQSGESLGCCGESSMHFEKAYAVEGVDELLMESEIDWIKDEEPA